ncbi:MAG: J domain-containing protein [Sideroxyarcus sp.]|nr:J domain-containing protein [Sideroxyarcus sp.]
MLCWLFDWCHQSEFKPGQLRLLPWGISAPNQLQACKIARPQEASLENPYTILGVAPTASTEDIKKAYRALAMRHHPDRNPHSSAEVRFNAIKKAYELLSDPQKRAEYNYSLNNRIIIDPENEAQSLWRSLFNRCGIELPQQDR